MSEALRASWATRPADPSDRFVRYVGQLIDGDLLIVARCDHDHASRSSASAAA